MEAPPPPPPTTSPSIHGPTVPGMRDKGKGVAVDESPQTQSRYNLTGSSENRYSQQLADLSRGGPILIIDREQRGEETRVMEAPPPPPPTTSPSIHGPTVPGMRDKGKGVAVDESPQTQSRYNLTGSSENRYSQQLADLSRGGPILIIDREQRGEETRVMEAPSPPPPTTSPSIHGPTIPRMRDKGKGVDDAKEDTYGGFKTQESMLMAMPPPSALHQTPHSIALGLSLQVGSHATSPSPTAREVMAAPAHK
ncbi:hypothetical protein V6N13_072072 [Hibiscus sabdariffa]|uniref:Uncharacterized protein n=1 Tax=Hibiscus sabdariffa TaxID=183260 RepID=A0ABR2TBQ0_9ROSI